MSALVAVLAGWRGRRMGGRKAVAAYGGAVLIERPPAAAAAAGLPAVVVAKGSTPVTATLAALDPAVIEVADARLVASVNTPEDLADA